MFGQQLLHTLHENQKSGMETTKKDFHYFLQELTSAFPKAKKDDNRHPFIVYYLNYISIFFLCPFKIKWDHTSGGYIAESSFPRRFACGLLLFAEFLIEVRHSVWHSPASELHSTVQEIQGMFALVTYLSTTPTIWLVTFKLWFRTGIVIKWINAIQENCSSVSTKFGYVICALVHFSLICTNLSSEEFRAVKETSENLVRTVLSPTMGNLRTFLEEDHCDHNHTHFIEFENGHYSSILYLGMNYTFTTVSLLLHTLFLSGETFCVAVVLTMWSFTKSLGTRMESESIKGGTRLYKRYRCCWNLTNELFGIVFLLMYVSFVSYFCRLQEWFMYYGTYSSLHITLENGLLFGLCSHIQYKTNRIIRQWISDKWDEPLVPTNTKLQLHSLTHEVDEEKMGFSSCFFTFSYQMLGSMLGSLITYAIIIYQSSKNL